MPSVYLSRRALVQKAMGLGALSATSKVLAAACAAPDSSDSGMRAELHYAEAAPDSSKRCAGCAFFSNLQGACGTCQILNGPVNPNGHCDSWAARS